MTKEIVRVKSRWDREHAARTVFTSTKMAWRHQIVPWKRLGGGIEPRRRGLVAAAFGDIRHVATAMSQIARETGLGRREPS